MFIWLMEVRPLVKRYTGGKAHCLWLSTSSLWDYFLAKKIIRGEKLKTPILIRINELLVIGTVIFFALTILETKMHNQRVDPTAKTPVESGNEQGTASHP